MIILKETGLQALRLELKHLFKSHNIESPDPEAGLLLMHVLGIDKITLLTKDMDISSKDREKIFTLANRRLTGEPIQYIIGSCSFMDLEFSVNPSTLIPRPETELLVEAVKERLPQDSPVTIWDIGCGSGCIGISLAHFCPNLSVIELDISEKALATAKTTATRYGLLDRITFLKHDILTGMPDLPVPDAIVSNPPYIPAKDILSLDKTVRDFEPISALDGGEDGLCFYRKIIQDAPLSPGGLLAFEIGHDQGPAVVSLLETAGYTGVTLLTDYAGLDRIVIGYKN